MICSPTWFRCPRSLIAGAVALLLAWSGLAQEKSIKPLNGVCYGPFRGAEKPGGTYPTEAEFDQDLGVLASLTAKIRTYGNESSLALIPTESVFSKELDWPGRGRHPGNDGPPAGTYPKEIRPHDRDQRFQNPRRRRP